MANPGKMVTGFNHNIKHKGRVFHVQTEDSGTENPHIITHLFLGGNILASKKTSYSDIAHAENLTELVRALMEEQHKEMLRNLIHGSYDEVVAQYTARAWQPGVLEGQDAPPAAAAAGAPVPPQAKGPAPTPAKPLPPEVVAAQTMAVKPKPREGGETIFGEDLISERSLDEVILSYLADDGTET